ncbi:hypothetical protein BJY01DRAFT_223283 [Aspergillus pseudoustus]|uniref:Uncharacterized protein n=1 Tax=Aspergillus pseudoustus TaxID=1810923 RepID=A0ABR4J6H2_9EURO
MHLHVSFNELQAPSVEESHREELNNAVYAESWIRGDDSRHASGMLVRSSALQSQWTAEPSATFTPLLSSRPQFSCLWRAISRAATPRVPPC